MTEARREQQKYRGLAAIVVTIALVSCGPLQSGKWYDSESDVPLRPMADKSKPKKKEEAAAREPGRVSQIWSRVRDTLDRRPEAQKQNDAARPAQRPKKLQAGCLSCKKATRITACRKPINCRCAPCWRPIRRGHLFTVAWRPCDPPDTGLL